MNKQSRKYLITINNPTETLNENIQKLLTLNPDYLCGADEVGAEGTPHQHIYIHRKNPLWFDSIKNLLPTCHIDYCRGTSLENRDYVFKEGKHLDSEKGATNDRNSHIEHGICPDEQPGRRTDIVNALNMVRDGYSNLEIIDEIPGMFDKTHHLNSYRIQHIQNLVGKKRRDNLEVYYIFGGTGVGKTTRIYETHGYDDVYRADCKDKHLFDFYEAQPVLLLDEFDSEIPMTQMLQLIDKFPKQLPARMTNKWLCATTIYIVSNTPLWEQYRDVQKENPVQWNAFLRRLTRVYCQMDYTTLLPIEIE